MAPRKLGPRSQSSFHFYGLRVSSSDASGSYCDSSGRRHSRAGGPLTSTGASLPPGPAAPPTSGGRTRTREACLIRLMVTSTAVSPFHQGHPGLVPVFDTAMVRLRPLLVGFQACLNHAKAGLRGSGGVNGRLRLGRWLELGPAESAMWSQRLELSRHLCCHRWRWRCGVDGPSVSPYVCLQLRP